MAFTFPSLSALTSPQTKKYLYPSLWLLLVIWFLRVTYSQTGHYHLATSNSTLANLVHKLAHSHSHVLPLPTNGNAPGVTANITTSPKVAVIIETRPSAALVPLILHFSSVLGPDWPVLIYTTTENFGSFSTSQALIRHQKSGRIIIRALPEGLYFPNWDSVSNFLTTPWLWSDVAPAEHVLLFQSDSVLCASSVRSVEDFFEYDFVGAPIKEGFGQGYNGGLSLRRASTMLRVLGEFEWKETGGGPEDQWYFARMVELRTADEKNGITDGIRLPSMEIARTFAVETINYPSPLGLHQPTRFIEANDHGIPLDDWCPEYKLARTDRIKE